MKNFRFLAAVMGLALSAGLALAQPQAPERKIDFKLSSQPLGDALNQFAEQSGLRIVFYAQAARGMVSPPMAGVYTPEAALKILLKGSTLQYHFVDANTVEIRDAGSAPAAAQPAGVNGMKLVQAQSEDTAPARDKRATAENPDESSAGVPEVLVRGKKTVNTDIQRTEDDAQPYVVFDREQIQRSMAVNLEDFLKTRLPMNTVKETNSQSNQLPSFRGNQSSINLRGLGTNQTLILVDGRRLPSVSGTLLDGEFNQPDINGIPLASIERIEVLPSTASGIYGGGATGGAINIITRKDYAGVEVQATYANTFDSDAGNRRLDASAGFSLEGGRTQISLAGSHSDANVLAAGDRDFVRRARALQLKNNAAAFFDPFGVIPYGYTSNVRSRTGADLVLDTGEELNSPFAYVPIGYAGAAADHGLAFLGTAGQYNLDLPRDNNGTQRSLLNAPTVDSASANVRRTFGGRFDAFLDVSWLNNKGRSFFSGTVPSNVTLPADAPNNPFNADVTVRFPSNGVSTPSDSDSKTLRATAGLIVRLPRRWMAEADYSWSRSRFIFTSTNPVISPLGGMRLRTGTDVANLDILRDVNVRPLNYSPYLLPSPNYFIGPLDTLLTDATLRAAGPLFMLPAGAATLSALAERREEEAQDAYSDSASFGTTFTPHRSQSVDSLYVELRAPLFGAENGRRNALELQASLRHDAYDTRSVSSQSMFSVEGRGSFPAEPYEYATNKVQSDDFTVGLRYTPVPDLTLRASLGTGFLPPSIAQIAPDVVTVDFIAYYFTDRERGDSFVGADVDPDNENAPIPVTYLSGGNPHLQPEQSRSLSAGFILTPHILQGLRLSVDYTRIRKTGEIASLDGQFILDNVEFFPGRVERGPNLSTDADGWLGPITRLDMSLVNIAATTVEAYDIQADYTWDTGRFGSFDAFALATRETHFNRRYLPNTPQIDAVGFSDGPLSWRGNFGLTWRQGPWTLGWNGQYFNGYRIYNSTDDEFLAELLSFNQGSARLASQTYHDAFAHYSFGGGTEIMLGVQNLLNTSPPILATAGNIGGYSAYGDPRLRRYSLSIRKSFQ